MSNNTYTVPESYPMNGGDDINSYTKNSSFQSKTSMNDIPSMQRAGANAVKAIIDDVIAEKLDVEKIFSGSKGTFRIADLGCSVGPNTFIAMQNITDAVQQKYQSQGLAFEMPEFQVFFNDHASNDFNTLFVSLPPERSYFATGVPGSFHGRLFPNFSLDFVYSSYALQCLSKVSEELLNKNSAVWNKGRVHYASAPDELAHIRISDITAFLDCRAKELMVGGLLVLIMLGVPNGIPHASALTGAIFDFLGQCLMGMAKEGLISEAQVDTFNLPVYFASPKEMTQLACAMHLRAGIEGIISKHFGVEIIDDLFDRFCKKQGDFISMLESKYNEGDQLFIVLKRI
ncbi:hypothetical protein ACB098_03G086200 [Castanea mollissima]